MFACTLMMFGGVVHNKKKKKKILPQKHFSHIKSKWMSKNSKFDADFKSGEKIAPKNLKQSY